MFFFSPEIPAGQAEGFAQSYEALWPHCHQEGLYFPLGQGGVRRYFLICLACRCGTPLHHSPMQWTVLFSNIIYLSQRTANPFLASSSQTSEVTTTEWARSQELWRKPAGLWDQLRRALGFLLEPLTLTFEGWLRVISHKLALQYIISPLLPWGHGFKDSGGRTWTGL